MFRIRGHALGLALVGLLALPPTAPAHAASARTATPVRTAMPAGFQTLLRFGACALGVAIMSTPASFVLAFNTCVRTLRDEIEKAH